MEEFNLTAPTGSHPAGNGQLVVTEFSRGSEQAAGGAPGPRGQKGVVGVGRPGVGPGSGKPVAFLDACDISRTTRISSEEWPVSLSASGGCRGRTQERDAWGGGLSSRCDLPRPARNVERPLKAGGPLHGLWSQRFRAEF